MNWIFIPARRGSKGIPFKNRLLFPYTADIIPDCLAHNTVVSTNDEKILKTKGYKFLAYKRDEELCRDETNIRDVLLDFFESSIFKAIGGKKTDLVCMLYLTYPTREWKEIILAQKFLTDHKARSLLCREEMNEEIHPYRYFYEGKNKTGKQIVKHDLYRRQDYPVMFKASHYIFMAYVDEIGKLNKNLWNKNTVFFPVDNSLDIDTENDIKKLRRKYGK